MNIASLIPFEPLQDPLSNSLTQDMAQQRVQRLSYQYLTNKFPRPTTGVDSVGGRRLGLRAGAGSELGRSGGQGRRRVKGG